MNKKILSFALTAAMVLVPFVSAQAGKSAFNIYGYQRGSLELVNISGSSDNNAGNATMLNSNYGAPRSYERLSINNAYIAFVTHIPMDLAGLEVGFRCEQFTYYGANEGWCNRDTKISVRHEALGEIMFGGWELPYSQMIGSWVDPFYNVGADGISSLMGNLGGAAAGRLNALTSLYHLYANPFEIGGVFNQTQFGALSFNRRQGSIIMYTYPHLGMTQSGSNYMGGRPGLQFRFAITADGRTDAQDPVTGRNRSVDPRIWSTGLSYMMPLPTGEAWLGVAYERHDDVSAVANIGGTVGTQNAALSPLHPDGHAGPFFAVQPFGLTRGGGITCRDSEDKAYRVAGRYAHDWGNGMQTFLSAMYEELDYDAQDCNRADNNGTPLATATAVPIWAGVERDAWMFGLKHVLGNGLDFRFSYMDADDYDCDGNVETANALNTAICQGDTDAEAYNAGVYFTMPNGTTEFRLTYSEVDNGSEARYDFGINHAGGATGVRAGQDIKMYTFGIVQLFD